jgi:hypothetical protein
MTTTLPPSGYPTSFLTTSAIYTDTDDTDMDRTLHMADPEDVSLKKIFREEKKMF